MALRMEIWHDIELAIARATGNPFRIASRDTLGGGCINETYRIEGSGFACFVKMNRADRAEMLAAEAAGLAALAEARAVRVPKPVCHGASRHKSWLVLEYIELGRLGDATAAALGRGLARLHGVTAGQYGWHRDNTIGSTPQVNAPAGDWITFWRERRLGYQLELARSKGEGAYRLDAAGRRLMEKLPAFFAGYRPAPSLLHGDLWSGNAAAGADGEPVLYDPAVYYGDRETDVAMTELFGGFPHGFYQAYRSEYPLDAGYETRKALYNLYHVLNHFNLFGGGYGVQAERMIGHLLAAV
jgi:protein-ribulosamine 3-kinase